MLIAVVSDTHRDTYSINNVLKKIQKADILIHLGDNVKDATDLAQKFKGRTIYVKGNCDFVPSVESEVIEEIEGTRFLITHGHNFGVKQSLGRLKQRAQFEKVHVALYGHTHVSSVVFESGIWYVNPGSAWEGRDGSESIAMIEIAEGKINPWLVIL
jgi:putative phosphoesterase